MSNTIILLHMPLWGPLTPRKKEVHLPPVGSPCQVKQYISTHLHNGTVLPLAMPLACGRGAQNPEYVLLSCARGRSRRWSWGTKSGGLGTEVPQWGPGAKLRQGVWGRSGRSPQKLEHFQNT